MINPLSTQISLPTINTKPSVSRPYKGRINTSGKDSFTSNINLNGAVQAEAKSSATFLELLFGNIINKNKSSKAGQYNKFEAELYAKPKNEEELKEFFANYQAPIKW